MVCLISSRNVQTLKAGLVCLQWLLQELDDWKWELDYCSKLLSEDSANNSAWNQVYYQAVLAP